MAIEKDDLKEYYGSSGDFITIRKLVNPGQKVQVRLIDFTRNYKTKYPIKDKEYNYRLTIEKDGKRYLLDLSGKDSIKQVVSALYPDGPDGELKPCFAIIERRTERKSYHGELQITRGD